MEERIKQIIAAYLKVNPTDINSQTLINRQAVSSSIILHRMYGELANQGFVIENYTDINHFSELMNRLSIKDVKISDNLSSIDLKLDDQQSANENGVGIDIESTSNFHVCDDYREDEFYKNNFSESEIAYCILKKDPVESFAGLFSVKEAIVKADSSYSGKAFRDIVISHDDTGKPIHPFFFISITHQNNLVISIAISKILKIENEFGLSSMNQFKDSARSSSLHSIISLLALLISLISLLVLLLKVF